MTLIKKWIVLGVCMATIMSLLLGCDIDKKAVSPILAGLSEKYGESFTVTSLGDRIGKNTATAYVIADTDPDMCFTARVDTAGNLVYEDYAARTVCRQVENLVEESFENQNMKAVSFCEFTPFDNDVTPGTSPLEYIRLKTPRNVFVSLVIRDGEAVSGEAILAAYREIYDKLDGLAIVTSFFVVTPADYDILYDHVRMETQSFDAYRLSLYGTKDPIRMVVLQMPDGVSSKTAAEVDAELKKEGD